MIYRTERIFEIDHDSGDSLMECTQLAAFLNENMPNHHVSWESCKRDFGQLIFTSEVDTCE